MELLKARISQDLSIKTVLNIRWVSDKISSYGLFSFFFFPVLWLAEELVKVMISLLEYMKWQTWDLSNPCINQPGPPWHKIPVTHKMTLPSTAANQILWQNSSNMKLNKD
jgi:hypothetical protein